MTDTTHGDLVKRLGTPMNGVTVQQVFRERGEARRCIEELEAKLGKAVEALMAWKHYNESDEEDHVSLMLNYGEAIEKTRATLAELTGGKDDNNYI
jgi:hypothetical protein